MMKDPRLLPGEIDWELAVILVFVAFIFMEIGKIRADLRWEEWLRVKYLEEQSAKNKRRAINDEVDNNSVD